QSVISSAPDDAEARFQLALALTGKGQIQKAMAELRATLKLAPNHLGALNNLAWELATNPDARLRNGPEALQLAERASRLPQGQTAEVLDTLAAAHAEAGEFPKAVEIANRGADLAQREGNGQLSISIRGRA